MYSSDIELFKNLSDRSQVWIFPLDRVPSQEMRNDFLASMRKFLAEWKAHGTPVPGEVEFVYGRFALIAAEPETTSGCSVDALFRAVEDSAREIGASVLRPDQVFYLNGERVVAESRSMFKERVQSGAVGDETIVFDNSISSVGQLRSDGWRKRFADSWHGKFFRKAS